MVKITKKNEVVEKFINQDYKLFVDGEYISAASGKTFEVLNPTTTEKIAEVEEGDGKDISYAIDRAKKAFPVWANYSKEERAVVLEKMGQNFRDNLGELAQLESLQTGRPIREMKSQLARLPEWFTYFASVLRTHEEQVRPFSGPYLAYSERFPLGVVGLITPWNHPLLILTKKLVPALAGGNSLVVKPSELAPLSVLKIGQIAKEAGVPDGVLNIVPGFGATAGAALCKDTRIAKIDVTGGTETGRIIAQQAGYNLTKISCELGGKASSLFFEDVDVDSAVNNAAFAAFIATGQTCVQGARLLVHESLYEEFVGKLAEKVKNIKIGDPLEIETQMGPLISLKQLELTEKYVRIGLQEGARLVSGGAKPSTPEKGYYFEPTIFADVKNDMRIAQEEIFGPITTVIPFKTEEEAIRLANSTEFGLAMSVWTNDIKRAHRVTNQLECGIAWINDHHRVDPGAPWGGIKLSGIGKENGITAYLAYTNEKTVIVNKDDNSFDWYDSSEIKRYS
ncbi:aldehyde dehydrogenase [Aquibacillus sediminis]|uniref:aldehyde dehydrogenase n=1 Tax=Aquibacillus sediminis TaxID=2574734 RepID=UPI001108F174|nr:aldehyde dehydrogenase [Aquibacillus sediminis]